MKTTVLIAAALALVAGAPAGAADNPAPKKPPEQCFYARMVNGFAAPDDENLYIRVGVNDVYHLTMMTHCLDMDWNQRIALQSRTGGFICHYLDAEVITHARGLGRQRCFVKAMEKLTPAQVAALPKRAKP